MNYEPFLVAPLNSGIATYLKPWLEPDNAYVEMEDCYLYRGVMQKRYGYNQYGVFPNKVGIKQVGIGNGSATTFNTTLDFATVANPVGKKSLTITHTNAGVVVTDGTDDGAGNLTGTNIAAGSTINYATGAIVLNFTVAPTINTPIRIDYGIRIAVGDGVTTSFSFTLPGTGSFAYPISLRSLYIRNTQSNQNTASTGDVPTNTVSGTLVPGTTAMSGTITYATGAGTVTFNTAPANAGANGDIWAQWQFQAAANPIKGIKFFWNSDGTQNTIVFNNNQMAQLDPANFKITNVTGANFFNTAAKNFFSVDNYLGKAYIVNNTDRLTIYDGTNVYQPIVSFTSGSPTVNELNTALHVFVFKNRLCLLRPTESNITKPQRLRFSALNNPLDWISNTRGHGGFVDAPTSDWIVSFEFLRDEVIVGFQTSTWKIRYTGVDTAPFRWEKINDMRRVDSPYAHVSYQNYSTYVGATGLVRCDGVNVDRYDANIIDFTEDELDQDTIEVVNTYRFDQVNQQLMCYPASAPAKTETDYSDKWLVWNFLEETFSIWNVPATCFGAYYQGRDLAWQDFNAANNMDWDWTEVSLDANWLSYFTQGKSVIPMFGTKTGVLNSILPSTALDNGTKTGFSFVTKDFNPYVKEGFQARLGYVDFYFDRPTVDTSTDTDYTITIEFYNNESETAYRTITLNPSQDNWIKKRVYANAIGNFHRFKVYLTDSQINTSTVTSKGFILSGYILYMTRAGRMMN